MVEGRAKVILVSERSARQDARRSLDYLRKKFPHAKILVHGNQHNPDHIAELIAQERTDISLSPLARRSW